MPQPVYIPNLDMRISQTARRVTRLERRPLPYIIMDHFKIYGDRTRSKVRSPAFQWTIGDDVTTSGLDVVGFRIYVTTVGSDCTCMLRNVTEGDDILTASLTIPAGLKTAYTYVTVDECTNYLDDEDELAIDCLVGGGTKGLGAYVFYGRDRRP
jgi:hypothetical protein